MNTAVQLRPLRDDLPRCDLVHGTPHTILPGSVGPVALFAPGQVVAYLLQSRRRLHLFVFRTLDVRDRLAASVPGVRPEMQLLLDLSSVGRVRLARGLFSYLIKHGCDPSGLPDEGYVRVSAALAGRMRSREVLLSLLSPSSRSVAPWTS
jgi:hypothetical protein